MDVLKIISVRRTINGWKMEEYRDNRIQYKLVQRLCTDSPKALY